MSAPTTTQQTLADRQIAALTALIEVLREDPDVAKYVGTGLRNLGTHVFASDSVDPREVFAEFIRAMKAKGATITKDFTESYAHVVADFGAVRINVQADRNEVCERVVTGTETVTKTVKDPDAVAALPDVEITEDVETFKWVCKPLLASEGDAEANA